MIFKHHGLSLSESMHCIKPNQFGLGFASSLNILPECQRVSEHNCNGKVYRIPGNFCGIYISRMWGLCGFSRSNFHGCLSVKYFSRFKFHGKFHD